MALTADQIYLLNHMNSTANKVQLGNLISTADTVVPADIVLASGSFVLGNGSAVGAAVALSGDITATNAGVTAIGAAKVLTAMIADANVTLAKLASGITPSHVVKFAGKHTTTGGNATETFTVTGLASTDVILATLQAKGGTPRTILTVAPTTDTVTLVFSGDPSTDHVVSYVAWRAAS